MKAPAGLHLSNKPLLFLILILLSGFVSASTIITLVTPDPTSNELFFYFWVNQTGVAPGTGINAGGIPDNNKYSLCLTNDSSWTCYDSSIFQFSCSGGSASRDYCTATVSLRGGNKTAPLPQENRTIDFTCVNPSNKVLIGAWAGSAPNCATQFGSSFSEIQDLTWLGGNVYWWNGAVWVARFNPAGGSSWCWKDVVDDGAGYFRFNKKACVVCNPGERMCAGDNSGDELHCVNGYWEGFLPCEKGGYVNCKGGDINLCSNIETNILVADKYRRTNRISIIANPGYYLSWVNSFGGYLLYSGQTISNTAFRLVTNETLDDWPIGSSDELNINYTWNPAELSCTSTSGSIGYDYGQAYYADGNLYTCNLNPGFAYSNITVTITANLTSSGDVVLVNTTIYKQFKIVVIKDIALMDNFQVVYINSTLIGFSGHIIKFSDLSEIPQTDNPFANITYAVFDNTTTALKSFGNTGELFATDYNHLYVPVVVASASAGDLYYVNMTIGADGYLNWTYMNENNYISPYRVLSFKCTNTPKNISYDSSLKSSTPVNFECSYMMANASSIAPINLSISSTIHQSTDLGIAFLGSETLPFSLGEVLTYVFSGFQQTGEYPRTFLRILYDRTVGFELQHSRELNYVQLDVTGNPKEITAGRYVTRLAVLDNPDFYRVKTYTDLIVEPSTYQGFAFPETAVSFNQETYKENDTVACSVYYYDVNGVVRDWKVTFSGDNSFSLDSDGVQSSVNETIEFAGFNCTPSELGVEGRLCRGTFSFVGLQQCLSYVGNSTSCLNYKWKFFNSGGSKKLSCTVTLYPSGTTGSDGVSRGDTATVLLSSGDFWAGIFGWWWLIIIIIILIVLYILRRAGKPETNIHVHNKRGG